MTEDATATPPQRIPISLLTGFLGSGKTTLLNRLVQSATAANAAVVINEFGEIGLDHLLVEKLDEETVVLSSGCLCCTIRDDIATTLRELFRRRAKGEVPPFDRLLIETTGLADPAPILHTLMTDLVVVSRYRLDGVITTVDAVHGADQLDRGFEPVKQAAVADRLLITKPDLVDADRLAALTRRLRAINPAAPIYPVVHGDIPAERLLGAGLFDPAKKIPDVADWLKSEAYDAPRGRAGEHAHDDEQSHDGGHAHDHAHHPHDVNRHDDHIRTFCLFYDEPVAWEAFAAWVDALTSTQGDAILRMKGIVHVTDTDKPVVVHGIHHVFHPPAVLEDWPDADRRTRIVLITRDLGREPVEQMFRAFVEAAPAG